MDFYQTIRKIDPVLEKPNPSIEEMAAVIQIIGDPAIRIYFFKHITSLKWFHELKQKGFFDPSLSRSLEASEQGLYSTAHWPALDYLERVSKQSDTPENQRYAFELMDIIRDVTKSEENRKADNYRTWWYFVKILVNLPTIVVTLDDIDLVSEWLQTNVTNTFAGDEIGKSLLPKFLSSPHKQDWIKAEKIIEIITRIHWTEKKYTSGETEQEANTAIETYWLRELFKNTAASLGEKCGQQVVDILIARLKEILDPTKDRYSYVWRRAIDSNSQGYGRDDTKQVLVSALRDILWAYSTAQPEKAEGTLRKLLADPLDIFKRIALYVVKDHYKLHGIVFWETVKPELFSANLRHELFELLRANFETFSSVQQDQIVNIIAELSPEQESTNDLFNAAERLRWLDAIKAKGSERADRLYDHYIQITGHTPTHPEFTFYMETSSVGEKAPCSVDELLNKGILEIVDYLISYRESGGWNEPTEEGLRDVLENAVKQRPDKFATHLNEFLRPELLPYQYSIVQAFVELWRDNKLFDKANVLEFCLSTVESQNFWQRPDVSKGPLRPTRSWITSGIADLIKAGSSDDQRGFEEQHLSIVEHILVILLEKEASSAKGEQGDALTEAINTPKGRSLEALFCYALYKARLYNKRHGSLGRVWKTLQSMFDHELEQCKDDNLEFSAMAGAYLLNLLYLSKPWVVTNVNKIFSAEYQANWRSALEGYAYVNTVHTEVYKLLKQHNHFQRALNEEFKNSRVREKIIQNIAVGYLKNFESLDDHESLFAEILRSWQEMDIVEIISLFWLFRDAKLQAGTVRRITNFWNWCYERINENEESNRKILSDLNLLAVFLSKISQKNKLWLLQSAPYVDEAHHSSFFLEYLARLADESAEEVAEIYLRMLTRSTPTYKEDEIRAILEKLYEKGLTDKANEICNEYARRGLPELLRDIYDRHNR